MHHKLLGGSRVSLGRYDSSRLSGHRRHKTGNIVASKEFVEQNRKEIQKHMGVVATASKLVAACVQWH